MFVFFYCLPTIPKIKLLTKSLQLLTPKYLMIFFLFIFYSYSCYRRSPVHTAISSNRPSLFISSRFCLLSTLSFFNISLVMLVPIQSQLYFSPILKDFTISSFFLLPSLPIPPHTHFSK